MRFCLCHAFGAGIQNPSPGSECSTSHTRQARRKCLEALVVCRVYLSVPTEPCSWFWLARSPAPQLVPHCMWCSVAALQSAASQLLSGLQWEVAGAPFSHSLLAQKTVCAAPLRRGLLRRCFFAFLWVVGLEVSPITAPRLAKLGRTASGLPPWFPRGVLGWCLRGVTTLWFVCSWCLFMRCVPLNVWF